MQTLSPELSILAEFRQQALAQAFGVTIYCWEKQTDWSCDDFTQRTSPKLSQWFDELCERAQTAEASTATNSKVYTTQIDNELWIASPLAQESGECSLLLAGSVPNNPAQLLQRCVDFYSQQESQVVLIKEQNSLIDSYATHMSSNYEEIFFLRQLSKNVEFCNVTRSISAVTATILPSLRQLISADAILFIPALDAQEQTHESLPIREMSEGNLPWCPAEQALFTQWIRSEQRSSVWIWNRNNGLHTTIPSAFPATMNSLLLVPVAKDTQRFGWFLAVNKQAEQSSLVQEMKLLGTDEFGSIEASLLQSSAVLLGSHALNVSLFNEQEKLIVDIIHTLVSVLEAKDIYTCGHSNRVALIARCLAETLGLPEHECENIYLAGLVHDVGKVGVADDILLKPDKLTEEEYRQIKTHPERGYRILQGLKPLASLLPGVLYHHEAVNGKGYPYGLQGEAIPLMARIIAVADAYDALTSDRAYRKGMSLEKTEAILTKERGNQWDEQVIDAYFIARDQIREIAVHWNNDYFSAIRCQSESGRNAGESCKRNARAKSSGIASPNNARRGVTHGTQSKKARSVGTFAGGVGDCGARDGHSGGFGFASVWQGDGPREMRIGARDALRRILITCGKWLCKLLRSTTIQFTLSPPAYSMTNVIHPHHPSQSYAVAFSEIDSGVRMQSVNFNGTSSLTFNTYGRPFAGSPIGALTSGIIVIVFGAEQFTVTVDPNTGEAIVS